MLKTLKRKIALVAVAALGFGLVSVAPANAIPAVAVAGEIGFKVDEVGITHNADRTLAAGATGVATNAYTRVGATLSIHTITNANAGGGGLADMQVRARITTAGGDNFVGAWIAAPAADAASATISVPSACGGVATCSLAVDVDLDGGALSATTALAAGEFTSTANQLITVVAGGTPSSLSYAQDTREIASAPADYTVNVTAKDANGADTILLDAETIVTAVEPQTGVAASTVDTTAASTTLIETEATGGGASTYAVVLDGNGDEGGNTGTTIAGTTYTMYSQLVTSGNAVGNVATGKYTRVSNTSGLTGTISFTSDTSGTALTTLATVPNVATSSFYAWAKDASGARLKGVTIALALSGVTGATSVASDTTTQAGYTSARTALPTAAGSGTITASISTGASSISATLPVTVVGFGATPAAIANVTMKANNGNGFKAGTALTGAWESSRTVTSITVTITGMDAGKTAAVEAGGSATGVKVAGIASDGAALDRVALAYITADASGTITIPVTLTSATNGQTALIGVYADGAGADDLAATPLTITFNNATSTLTTSPATTTTSFVATSSTQNIEATVADQFSNAILGGSFEIANTTVPATVTAQTTTFVNADANGKAKLAATIGSVAGSYVFTVKARDPNGTQLGQTSTITYTATADGAPGSVTLTGGGSEDGTGTYTVWVSPNGTVPNTANATADAILATDTTAAAKAAKYGNWIVITASVKNAAGAGVDNVKVEVTGTSGLYFKATAPAGADKLSTMTATSVTTAAGGVATVYAVATKAGNHTVTLKVGSKTATASFSAATGIATTSVARKVALSSSTVAVTGNAITQVIATVTDEFGNAISGVDLTGTVTGAAGRFAGGSRSFAAKTDAAGQVIFELTGNASESGAGTLTVAGVEDTDANPNTDNEVNEFASSDFSGNLTGLSKTATSSVTATLAVTAATGTTTETAAIKADVKAVSDTVATLSKAVTTVQSSVTELTTSFTSQIKSLTSAIAKISRAIAAIQKSLKARR